MSQKQPGRLVAAISKLQPPLCIDDYRVPQLATDRLTAFLAEQKLPGTCPDTGFYGTSSVLQSTFRPKEHRVDVLLSCLLMTRQFEHLHPEHNFREKQ